MKSLMSKIVSGMNNLCLLTLSLSAVL